MIIVHLPDGPTATFKLSNIKLPPEIPVCNIRPRTWYMAITVFIQEHGEMSLHNPELILNNFTTRLGHGIGRMFASLFPQVPEFTGRRVITFHSQRDFIFLRQHRYGDK